MNGSIVLNFKIAVCCCVEHKLFGFESCAGFPFSGGTLVERLISIHNGNYSTILCFPADPLSSSRTLDPERVNVAPHSAFWISTEVVTALVSCYTAGATWNCWSFGARSAYTIKLCTTLRYHFIRSHMRKVHARLAVTWPLHFWLNGWDILCATAIKLLFKGYRNMSQDRKLTLEKTILPLILPGLSPATFRSRVRRCTSEPFPTLPFKFK